MTQSRNIQYISQEINDSVGAVDISVVIPVMNEEESVPHLAAEIEIAFENTGYTWETVWIDDGSSDNTLAILRNLHQTNPNHRYVSFAKNSGQSFAMATGFRYARGRILGTMDGDLQNDPKDLPRLAKALEKSSVHMVNGYRKIRQDSLIRKLASRIANSTRERITGHSVRDVGCSIRVFYRECMENIPVFKGMHRFFPTLVKMQGYRMKEMPVNHRPRTYGETKYCINNRLWVGIGDMFWIRWYQHRFTRVSIAEWK